MRVCVRGQKTSHPPRPLSQMQTLPPSGADLPRQLADKHVLVRRDLLQYFDKGTRQLIAIAFTYGSPFLTAQSSREDFIPRTIILTKPQRLLYTSKRFCSITPEFLLSSNFFCKLSALNHHFFRSGIKLNNCSTREIGHSGALLPKGDIS